MKIDQVYPQNRTTVLYDSPINRAGKGLSFGLQVHPTCYKRADTYEVVCIWLTASGATTRLLDFRWRVCRDFRGGVFHGAATVGTLPIGAKAGSELRKGRGGNILAVSAKHLYGSVGGGGGGDGVVFVRVRRFRFLWLLLLLLL